MGNFTINKTAPKIKVVLLGDSGVGKTSLLLDLKGNKENRNTEPTIFENIYHYLEYQSECYLLDITDTSGRREYQELAQSALNYADVVLLCYSIDNRKSFQSVEEIWIPELKICRPEIPKILIGLKMDRRYSQRYVDEYHCISYQQGALKAEKHHLEYLEYGCSLDNSKPLGLLTNSEESHIVFGKVIDTVINSDSKKYNKKKTNCLIL